MRTLLWLGFVALFLLHQDVWFWHDPTLVFGFLPVGLAYHAGFSVAASLLWLAMVKLAWPSELEAWADVQADAPADPPTPGADPPRTP